MNIISVYDELPGKCFVKMLGSLVSTSDLTRHRQVRTKTKENGHMYMDITQGYKISHTVPNKQNVI